MVGAWWRDKTFYQSVSFLIFWPLARHMAKRPKAAYGQGKKGRLRGYMEPVGPLPRRSSIKGVEFKVSLPKLPALGLN